MNRIQKEASIDFVRYICSLKFGKLPGKRFWWCIEFHMNTWTVIKSFYLTLPPPFPSPPECHMYAVFWTVLVLAIFDHFLSLLALKTKFIKLCTKF